MPNILALPNCPKQVGIFCLEKMFLQHFFRLNKFMHALLTINITFGKLCLLVEKTIGKKATQTTNRKNLYYLIFYYTTGEKHATLNKLTKLSLSLCSSVHNDCTCRIFNFNVNAKNKMLSMNQKKIY